MRFSTHQRERVAENLVGFLADAIHTARALNKPNDGPRQIVVHNDIGVLEVLAFTQNVGGNQNAKFFFRFDLVALLVAVGTKPPSVVGGVYGLAGDACEPLHVASAKLRFEVADSVGKLGENDNFLIRVSFRQKLEQGFELGVGVGFPIAAAG